MSLKPIVDPDVPREAAARSIRVGFTLAEPDRVGMLPIADLVERGRLRAAISNTFPLAQAAKAHELGETGATALMASSTPVTVLARVAPPVASSG